MVNDGWKRMMMVNNRVMIVNNGLIMATEGKWCSIAIYDGSTGRRYVDELGSTPEQIKMEHLNWTTHTVTDSRWTLLCPQPGGSPRTSDCIVDLWLTDQWPLPVISYLFFNNLYSLAKYRIIWQVPLSLRLSQPAKTMWIFHEAKEKNPKVQFRTLIPLRAEYIVESGQANSISSGHGSQFDRCKIFAQRES